LKNIYFYIKNIEKYQFFSNATKKYKKMQQKNLDNLDIMMQENIIKNK
jgi:hypothetical protein